MTEGANRPDLIITPAFVPTAELEYLDALADGLSLAGFGHFCIYVPKDQTATAANQTRVIITTPSGSSDLFEGPRQAIEELFRGSQTPKPEAVRDLITLKLRAMQEERTIPYGRPYARPIPYR
jgi:hypothetical protein